MRSAVLDDVAPSGFTRGSAALCALALVRRGVARHLPPCSIAGGCSSVLGIGARTASALIDVARCVNVDGLTLVEFHAHSVPALAAAVRVSTIPTNPIDRAITSSS